MSRGSSRMFAVGGAALLGAWSFGSSPLAVVAIGLLLAGAGARLWARLARRALTARRAARSTRFVEGERAELEFDVRAPRALPLGAITVRSPFGPLGPAELRVGAGKSRVGLDGLSRGRYELPAAQVEVEDPLGLERFTVAAGPPLLVLVRPRVPELRTLFSEQGSAGHGGRRPSRRSPSGTELHTIRDHREGEALRAVHWPSTARHARLMVKELDEAPRVDVVVVLDQDRGSFVGSGGRARLDLAVRAAGALALAHLSRGRRVSLLLAGAAVEVVALTALERDWPAALDALAAVEAHAEIDVAGVLADPRLPASRATSLVLVSGRAGGAATALHGRSRARSAALVAVESASAPRTGRAEQALLRAVAAGIAVARLRPGDDVAAVLEGAAPGRVLAGG